MNEIEQMIVEFRSLSVKQYEFSILGKYRVANKALDALNCIVKEIILSGDTSIGRLIGEIQNPNDIVASSAAFYCGKWVKEDSIAKLKSISQRRDMLGLIAREAAKRLQEGVFVVDSL